MMKIYYSLCLFIGLMLSSLAFASYQESIDKGERAFQRGHFERAAEYWEGARKLISQNDPKYIDTSIRLSAAYQSLGHVKRALKVLESALPLAKNDSERKASVLLQLSNVYLAMRDFQERDMDCSMKEKIRPNPLTQKEIMNEAWYYLEEAEKTISYKKNRYPLLWANILNSKGNVAIAYSEMFNFQESVKKAKEHAAGAASIYQESIQYAEDDKVLKAKISINKLQALAKWAAYKKEEELEKGLKKIKHHPEKLEDSHEEELKTVLEQVRQLDDSHEKVFDLINLASVSQHKQKLLAYDALKQALTIAENLKDKESMAYAKYYLAQLYAKDGRYPEGIQLTKQGILHVQSHLFYSKKRGDKMINYGGDRFVPDRFKVYLPSPADETSLFGWNTTSEKDCKKKCQERDSLSPSSQDIFSKNCKGICQDMSPLSTQNYHPELLFRLERQLGEFLKAQGQSEEAIDAYKRAVKYFRHEYRTLSPYFRDMEEKAYFELADLLLEQAFDAPPSKKQALLKDAIDNIESFKAAELQNYYQDECITEFEDKAKTVVEFLSSDPNKTKTAIFYPIVLEDRVELLLVFHNGDIKQFKTDMTAKDLKWNVKYFRIFLEDFMPGDPYAQVDYAKTLYDGLIQPINTTLKQKNIDTLIIISHGDLLTIPFAALYDRVGEKYFIKDYAIAVAPGWKLTNPGNFQYSEENQALLIGLSILADKKIHPPLPEEMQFPLVYVKEELHQISQIFKKNEKLENKKFTISRVEEYLTNNAYSIVHFSTHGLFEDDPNKRFLLAYDERLTMIRLGTLIHTTKFHQQPIELLNLSACLSAYGDKRIALGLSGMALRTGVRSVLGALWNATDQITRDNKVVTPVTPTVDIMRWFYEAITKQGGNSSKAKALQEAQNLWLEEHRKLKNGSDSPFFWAPFVVIGNWQ